MLSAFEIQVILNYIGLSMGAGTNARLLIEVDMRSVATCRIALVGLLALGAASPVAGEGIFPDKNLETVVRQYVFEKRNNEEPLTEKDVENIAIVVGKGKGIKDLTGLEKCYSLAQLDLENNEISDLSAIRELTNLQSINLAKNKIEDISSLSELTKVQYLHLADNQVADLNPVEKMQNMRSLYLSNNRLEDVSTVGKLPRIWSLYLDGNQVKDIKPLSELKWLSSLDLTGNGIEDIKPLASLTELKYLFLEDNQVSDLSVLVEMAKKDSEGDQRFASFWNLFLAGNPLSDEAKGAQVEEIKRLGGKVSLKPSR